MNAPASVRRETWLWLLQRATAAVLAFAVVVHLVTMIGAVRGGLSAAEILARTRGSGAWLAFYAVFVLAVAIHAPIGLRAVLAELARGHRRCIDLACLAFGVVLLVVGMRAVMAVTR
jgi:fumarate reductase subunit C